MDGVTSKASKTYDGVTSGKLTALVIQKITEVCSPDIEAADFLKIANTNIQQLYEQYHISELVQKQKHFRFGATFILLNKKRKELWILGDCKLLIDQEEQQNNKKIDTIIAEIRSLFIQSLIKNDGYSYDSFLANDIGREFVKPLLKMQMEFSHNFDSEFGYAVLDGFENHIKELKIIKINENVKEIVIASDGYPILCNTLKESEEKLKKILQEDPLLINKVRSTKGLKMGNVSFDDRSYLKIRF